MFDSFDIDRNGWIDAVELGRALAYYKFARLSNHSTFFH